MAEARVAAELLMLMVRMMMMMMTVVVVAVPRLAAVVVDVQGQRESPQCSRAVAMTALAEQSQPS